MLGLWLWYQFHPISNQTQYFNKYQTIQLKAETCQVCLYCPTLGSLPLESNVTPSSCLSLQAWEPTKSEPHWPPANPQPGVKPELLSILGICPDDSSYSPANCHVAKRTLAYRNRWTYHDLPIFLPTYIYKLPTSIKNVDFPESTIQLPKGTNHHPWCVVLCSNDVQWCSYTIESWNSVLVYHYDESKCVLLILGSSILEFSTFIIYWNSQLQTLGSVCVFLPFARYVAQKRASLSQMVQNSVWHCGDP